MLPFHERANPFGDEGRFEAKHTVPSKIQTLYEQIKIGSAKEYKSHQHACRICHQNMYDIYNDVLIDKTIPQPAPRATYNCAFCHHNICESCKEVCFLCYKVCCKLCFKKVTTATREEAYCEDCLKSLKYEIQ